MVPGSCVLLHCDKFRRYTHVRGGFLDAQSGDIVTFDARKLHGVETVSTGLRTSVIAHTPQLRRVRETHWKGLLKLKFPIQTVHKVWKEQYCEEWRFKPRLRSGTWKGRSCLWHVGNSVYGALLELGCVAKRITTTEVQRSASEELSPQECMVYVMTNGLSLDFMAEAEQTECKVLPRQIRRTLQRNMEQMDVSACDKDMVIDDNMGEFASQKDMVIDDSMEVSACDKDKVIDDSMEVFD
eukprot:936521-Amphidinium_carterae.1